MRRAGGWLFDLDGGPVPYAEVWGLQHELLRARQSGAIPDVLMLLEHRPVVTIGRSGDRAHVLMPAETLAARGVDLFEIERGGSATYHGPGQLVGYPIIDLRGLGQDVGRYMRTLETTVIETLEAFGIVATRKHGYPGVWTGEAKICAMGVAIKRRVTMHGFALNVTTDLGGFEVINPCGLGRPVTSMAAALDRHVDMGEVRRIYADRFSNAFGIELARMSREKILTAVSQAQPALAKVGR